MLCITLIISLGADQYENLNNRVVAGESLNYFHLEELDATTMGEVNSLLQKIHLHSTVLIFASPQCILNTGSKITYLIISHPMLLRFLVVDELYIFIHFGKSFRELFSKFEQGFIRTPVCTNSFPVTDHYLYCAYS